MSTPRNDLPPTDRPTVRIPPPDPVDAYVTVLLRWIREHEIAQAVRRDLTPDQRQEAWRRARQLRAAGG